MSAVLCSKCRMVKMPHSVDTECNEEFMNNKDKEEFDEWFIKTYRYDYKDLVIPESIKPQKEAWQAACEYKETEIKSCFNHLKDFDDEIGRLQAENKKLREALESIRSQITSWYISETVLIERILIAAREALKEVAPNKV